jgi:hypothetical protein
MLNEDLLITAFTDIGLAMATQKDVLINAFIGTKLAEGESAISDHVNKNLEISGLLFGNPRYSMNHAEWPTTEDFNRAALRAGFKIKNLWSL